MIVGSTPTQSTPIYIIAMDYENILRTCQHWQRRLCNNVPVDVCAYSSGIITITIDSVVFKFRNGDDCAIELKRLNDYCNGID